MEIQEIQNKGLSHIIIRGKYVASFFLMFCNSIEKECECSNIGIKQTGKSRGSLGERDVMEVIAPRATKPQSLLVFIDNTIVKYLTSICQGNTTVATPVPVNS